MVGRGIRLSLGYQWVSGILGFGTGSHNIDQAGLELMGYTCLCLLSALKLWAPQPDGVILIKLPRLTFNS